MTNLLDVLFHGRMSNGNWRDELFHFSTYKFWIREVSLEGLCKLQRIKNN